MTVALVAMSCSRARSLGATALMAAAVVCAPRTASAQAVDVDTTPPLATKASPPPVQAVQLGTTIGGATEAWQPSFRYETGLADYVVTGAAAAVAVGAAIVPPREGPLKRGLLFDDDVRDALRLRTLDQRYRARDASDVGVSLLTTWPILVDGLVSAWWYRGNSALAKDIAIVDAEVVAVVAALQGATNGLVGRQRPLGNDCGGAVPETSSDCGKNVRQRSFFSGHSAQAFASAGVLCVNHLRMRLLGDGKDVATCLTALGVAAATGTLRIVGDMHYATDVLTGALVGSSVGVFLPLLHGREHGAAKTDAALRVRIVPVPMGLGLGGTF